MFFPQIQVHTDANEAIGTGIATDLDHSENNVSHGDWWCQQCNDDENRPDRVKKMASKQDDDMMMMATMMMMMKK